MRYFCEWIKSILEKWKKSKLKTCEICGHVFPSNDVCEFCNAERRFLI
jgi:recombinational DNA repair protein RecR